VTCRFAPVVSKFFISIIYVSAGDGSLDEFLRLRNKTKYSHSKAIENMNPDNAATYGKSMTCILDDHLLN
jgi:hypothetical protein